MIQQYIFHRGHRPEEVIQAKLAKSPYFRNRNFDVQFNEGEVTLRGEVYSYYEKQVIQESIRHVTGVQRIQNLVDVV